MHGGRARPCRRPALPDWYLPLAYRADRAPWRLVLPLAAFSPALPAMFALDALPELLEPVGARRILERPADAAA